MCSFSSPKLYPWRRVGRRTSVAARVQAVSTSTTTLQQAGLQRMTSKPFLPEPLQQQGLHAPGIPPAPPGVLPGKPKPLGAHLDVIAVRASTVSGFERG